MSNKVRVTINGKSILAEPIQNNLAGDFIGFTFDNTHSSDFNLVRVSDGSRYESNLLPSFQDATVQIEGKDGVFYFGSNLKEKSIKISTAFDNLTEENYRKLAETFADKKLHKLWFDETPYKFYYVKLKQSPVFKSLCFDEGVGRERIYRGEMDLEFTCYSAKAEARASHLNQLLPKNEYVIVYTKSDTEEKSLLLHNHYLMCPNTDENGQDIHQNSECSYDYNANCFYKFYGADGATLEDSYNLREWEGASRLEKTRTIKYIQTQEGAFEEIVEWKSENQETKETTESFEWSEGMALPIYNPGIFDADVRIIFTPNEGTTKFPNTQLVLYAVSRDFEDKKILKEKTRIGIKQFDIKDTHIFIDSKIHLIGGLTVDQKESKTVYNKYHINGDFFDIPKSKYEDGLYLRIENKDKGDMGGTWKLEYKIYYV